MSLIGVALLMLVGHVCVGPAAAHSAGPLSAAHHHDESGGRSDSSHAAVCAGMVVEGPTSGANVAWRPAAAMSLAFALVRLVALPAPPRESTRRRIDASPPPLFLLHASLLI